MAAEQGTEVGAGGLLIPLRRRDVRLVVVGQSLSTLGDMLFTVALPFMLLAGGVRAGARDLAVTLVVLGTVRLLATPLGGILADRWHPRTVMLLADGARALAVLLFLPWDGAAPGLWRLAAGAVVMGLFEGIFLPAYRVMMPTLVPDEELAAANSVGEAGSVLAVVLGPLIAGVAVVAFGAGPVIAVNAATFGLSAILLSAMRAVRPPAPAPVPAGGLAGFVRRTPLFTAVLVMTGALGLTAAAVLSVALPALAAERYPDGARVFGYLLAANGAGLLVGTVLAGGVRWPRRRGLLAVGLLAVHGLGLFAIPYVGLALALPILALLGLVDGALGVLVITVVQRLAPEGLRGRVMAAFTVVRTSVFPLAAAVAGAVVTALGAPAMFVAAGVGVFVVSVLGVGLRAVREA